MLIWCDGNFCPLVVVSPDSSRRSAKTAMFRSIGGAPVSWENFSEQVALVELVSPGR